MRKLRFRQVHLDFHTSEAIRSVGERFDPRQFQEALKRGHVDSITIFSKCHHGLSYHNTRIGQRHPGLDFELMPRQIEACRAIGVRCPIYLSAGLDEWMGRRRPEWIAMKRDGKIASPVEARFRPLGFDTPYLDYLCAQLEEAVENYDCEDGIFLDIIGLRDNFSPLALTAMEAAGVDPLDEAAVEQWKARVLQNYYARATAAAKKNNPDRPVFHNSGHIAKGADDVLCWQSHLELESLPTGGWGYDHFPVSAGYARTTGKDFLGMTGKFHTMWGEFGGFKRSAALRYECAAMLAFGAKCSIGDQLHPSGEMSFDTYDLIGGAYAEVEQKQAWCEDVTPVCDIALVSPEARHPDRPAGHESTSLPEEGAARMLLELGRQFDVVDLERDLDGYKVVILPDEPFLEGDFLPKIERYLAGGGKLLLSGQSGLNPEGGALALSCGLRLIGKSAFDPDYLVPTENAPTPPVRGPFVVHGGAWNVEAEGTDWQLLASRRDPYFNRAWNHFCSHQHTPDAADSPFPGVLCNGEIAYFAHSIFTAYRQLGQPLYRDLLADALRLLLPEPSVETSLPSAGRVTLMRQNEQGRAVLHLLFALPQKRGANASIYASGVQAVEIIEDLFPLRGVRCRVRLPETIESVRLAPSGEELPFERNNGAVSFEVPEVLGHQMVELRFAP